MLMSLFPLVFMYRSNHVILLLITHILMSHQKNVTQLMNILQAEYFYQMQTKLMNILHGECSSVKILCNPTEAIASKNFTHFSFWVKAGGFSKLG